MPVILREWTVFALAAFWTGSVGICAENDNSIHLTPPASTPVTVKLNPAQLAAFHSYLVSEQKQSGIPGLTVVLVQPGETLLQEGLGVRQIGGNLPVTVNTRFALGPATQAVNSLLLARLAEEQVLSLDGPAPRYWDEFRLADAVATPKVTLRHFLSMTAGLPSRTDNFLSGMNSSPADLFSIVGQIPVLAQPGREFAYSDASVATAGYLAVYAANKHHAPVPGLAAGYVELLKKEIFEPLGMPDATFGTTDNDAVGHSHDPQAGWKSVNEEPASGGALWPALGLRTSARDVAAWLQLEVSNGIDHNGKSFVLADALQERWRTTDANDQREYALGWATQHYRGIEIVTRAGEYDHQAELVAIIPQYRTAFALLTNGSGKETSVFLQDALLNLTDMLKEAAAGQ